MSDLASHITQGDGDDIVNSTPSGGLAISKSTTRRVLKVECSGCGKQVPLKKWDAHATTCSGKAPDNVRSFADPHVLKGYAYARGVVDGSIPACKSVRQACERQLRDLDRQSDPSFPYRFDDELAGRACRFLENLPHVEGALAGQLVTLEGWQCFVVTTVYGWVKKTTGFRRFRRAYIEVPRGNGKSFMLSGLALYGLAADGEEGAQVYSAATSRDQAKVVWNVSKQMLRHRPALKSKIGIDSSVHAIFHATSGSTFKPLSREAKSLDGLNTHVAVMDELHAHVTREVYDVVETSTAKRTQSLLWVITTAGSDLSGICYEVRGYVLKVLGGLVDDDSQFGVVYTIDAEDLPGAFTDEKVWAKANPNWGVSVEKDAYGRLAAKAAQVASAQNNFLTKHLNVWCNADQSWLNMVQWDRCADTTLHPDDFGTDPCFIGLDLASKTDIAAKIRLFVRQQPHRVPERADRGETEPHYYAFLDSFLPENAISDGRNASYAGWEIEGRITTTPGDVLDFAVVKESLLADRDTFDVREVPYDPWQMTQMAQELTAEGLVCVECRPTVQNFSPAMKELEALVIDGRFHYDANPVLRWMASNVVCHRDAKDNIYPRKGPDPRLKIDGIVALLMALSRAMVSVDDSAPLFYSLEPVAE